MSMKAVIECVEDGLSDAKKMKAVIECVEDGLSDPTDAKKMKAVIECVEDIPCDPCVKSCPVGAISKKSLSAAPRLDENKCTGCANCVPMCPGRAIFVIGEGKVVVPYEFLPAPKKDQSAELLDREGKKVGTGRILAAREFDRTFAVTVSVPIGFEKDVRNIRIK